MNIRKATFGDIELLVKLRFDFISEEFENTGNEEAIRAQLIPHYEKHLRDDTFIAAIAEIDGQAVSTAYLQIIELPANPAVLSGRTAMLLNVLTYRQHRRQGIAAKVLLRIIEEAKLMNVSVITLSATDDGKTLYEKLGFTVSERTEFTEMKLKL